MAKTKTKSGSKVKVPCQLCGKVMTKAGLIGHMRFKHGKDHKAPMVPVDRPEHITVARQKAAQYDAIVKSFEHYKPGPLSQLIDELTRRGTRSGDKVAYLADFSVLIKQYASKQGISYDSALQEVKREKQAIDLVAKMFK